MEWFWEMTRHDVPIIFAFSGDDDVWVFIDGKLALDVGGAHGKVTGTLDFSGKQAEKKATVSKRKGQCGRRRCRKRRNRSRWPKNNKIRH